MSDTSTNRPPVILVERDGLTVVLAEPLGPAGPAARRGAIARLAATLHGPLAYIAESGDQHTLAARTDPDVVAALAGTPPVIAERLGQEVVDTILALGDSPEGKAADRLLRDHAALAHLLAETCETRDRQSSGGYVDRRVTAADLEAALASRTTARAKAEALLALLPAHETRGGHAPGAAPVAGPSERARITATLHTLARDLITEFDAFVAEANSALAKAFDDRATASRDRVEARYRAAYDSALKTLREPGARRVLFVRPRLEIDRLGHLALVLRPHILARAVRYGGFQAPLDVDVAHGDLERLMRQRTTPLWLRIYDPDGIPSWHATSVARRLASARTDARKTSKENPLTTGGE